jgi:hypothetical protein
MHCLAADEYDAAQERREVHLLRTTGVAGRGHRHSPVLSLSTLERAPDERIADQGVEWIRLWRPIANPASIRDGVHRLAH